MAAVVFGDAEPEDAWHPDDPVPELVANLARRVALLLAVVDRRRPFGPGDRIRMRLLADDLAHVLRRLE